MSGWSSRCGCWPASPSPAASSPSCWCPKPAPARSRRSTWSPPTPPRRPEADSRRWMAGGARSPDVAGHVEDVAVAGLDQRHVVVDPHPGAAGRRGGQAVAPVVAHLVAPEPVGQVIALAPGAALVVLRRRHVAPAGDEQEAQPRPRPALEPRVAPPPVRVAPPGRVLVPAPMLLIPLLAGAVSVRPG